jgi:hypothetical protein
MPARVSLILGASASGKSRSVKNLPPKMTFVVNVVGKDLPFKGSESLYPICKITKDAEKNILNVEGNVLVSKNTGYIRKVLKWVSNNRPEIKFIIIDDNQYISLFTYTKRIDEKDWAKYNTIAVNMVDLVEDLKELRPNLQIYILQHIETGEDANGDAQIQAKTMGKFVKEKVTYEGLFTMVLLADKEDGDEGVVNHFFWTRKSKSTVKSPEDMFKEQKIPNDLLIVAKAVREYYS